MAVANVVETMWLTRYTCPTEIKYYQVSEFIGHEFKNSLIQEEYGIKYKPITSRNPTSNVILERIHLVLVNLVWAFNLQEHFVDKDYPWMGIIYAEAFSVSFHDKYT